MSQPKRLRLARHLCPLLQLLPPAAFGEIASWLYVRDALNWRKCSKSVQTITDEHGFWKTIDFGGCLFPSQFYRMLSANTTHLAPRFSSKQDFSTFLTALPKCVGLLSLDLSHCNIDGSGFQTLASVLPGLEDLTTLKLSSNRFDPKSCSALAKLLPALKSLSILDLSRNHMFPVGCYALAGVLPVLKCLKTLNLEGNHIQNNGCIALTDRKSVV